MSTDTIDLRPLARHVEHDLRYRPTRRLICWGIALATLGLLALASLAAKAAEIADSHVLREAELGAVIVAAVGGFAIVSGIAARIIQRSQDENRRDSRAKNKKDNTELLTASQVEQARRDHRILDAVDEVATGVRNVEAQLPIVEERVDQLDRKYDAQIQRVGSAVVRLGDQIGRVERMLAEERGGAPDVVDLDDVRRFKLLDEKLRDKRDREER